jgi:hypothetical protein
MESTWETRDLPVLDAIVRYYDEDDSAVIPDVQTFAEITGMDPGQVARAVRALSPRFIKTGPSMGGLMDVAIMGITDEARQVVGQWPSPEVWVERLSKRWVRRPSVSPTRRRRAVCVRWRRGSAGSPGTWPSG